MSYSNILTRLEVPLAVGSSGVLPVHSPIDGSEIGRVTQNTPTDTQQAVERAQTAFQEWRLIPAPKRGELVRLLGNVLREYKEALGELVSIEAGKILEEGKGEVQEMIDICDFAVGLSRQLYGLTIASERPGHRMMEVWQPLGPVGVISAFNFPVAVWSWNATLALVCGDPVIWKPSEKTPLTALACQKLFEKAVKLYGDPVPPHLTQVLIGNREAVGDTLVNSENVPLISATGSTRMGREVGPQVAKRFGKCILELGGNNAMIVSSSADLDMAVRGILFSAVGTAGQRCTSLRRIIVHESIYDKLMSALKIAYGNIKIGNPLESGTLMGPLIDRQAYMNMEAALEKARNIGAKILGGGRTLQDQYPNAYYVNPAIVELAYQPEFVQEETFAPILYALKYREFEDALKIHNDVPQGLSSCIFTLDVREAEQFLSVRGSDCGMANVNIGPSGAEIGGAFGGEKETGGGRESGSDAWKAYMRRQTNTVNYSTELPLAQGITFDV